MPSENTEQRKLAAIMFTDMVGYSALSQRNEALALELLAENQRLLRTQFPLFNGREVKTTGDGFLVEFPSALQATQCAVEIQRAVAARNGAQPGERHVQVRIGIHVGDVVHREADMYGDGVNIAARIEPLAIGGGICLSDTVYAQVRNKLDVGLTKLNAPDLKHIEVPMDVYRVVLPWDKSSSSRRKEAHSERGTGNQSLVTSAATKWGGIAILALAVGGVGWWLFHPPGQAGKQAANPPTNAPGSLAAAATSGATDQKSIAVLPFVNMSADKADEYLSDGMTEELLNVLAQVPGLRVPGRSSCFAFKGKTEDNIFRKVGEQLHVTTVLEGSVRKAGDKLRITAQLINVADGFHLWSETYDRDMTNIFAIQSDVAQRVAAALKIRLGAEEAQSLVKRPTESLAAYQHYLQALNEWNKFTKEGFENCIRHANEALLLDAKFALAWEAIGRGHSASAAMGYVRPKEAWPAAQVALDKALALDDQLAEAHASRAAVAMFSKWDWETARRELETVMQLKPNCADGHGLYAIYLMAMGRLPEALAAFTRGQEVDPLSPNAAAELGNCQIYLGRPERAIEEGRKALQRTPDFPTLRAMLAVAYIALGNAAEGIAVMKQMKGIENNPLALSYLGYAYGAAGENANAQRVIEELERLEKAGHHLAPTYWARVYLGLGETNRALEWLERIPDEGDGFVPYIKFQPPFNRLRSEPRFVAVLKKLGLDP